MNLFLRLILVNGAWTPFSSYSICSAICANGVQASYRECRNQTSGGLTCTGYGLQFQNCSGFNDSYQCTGLYLNRKMKFILYNNFY